MKFIITENQNKLRQFLRRLREDDEIEQMADIVEEDFDYIKPCDHKDNFGEYKRLIIQDSAMCYVLFTFEPTDEYYDECIRLVEDIMNEKFSRMIWKEFVDVIEMYEC